MEKSLKNNVSNWELLNENLLKINMQLHQRKIKIIGIYALSEDEPIIIVENFYNNLHEIIADIGDSRNIVLLADLNARVGSEIHNLVVGPYGEQKNNDNERTDQKS